MDLTVPASLWGPKQCIATAPFAPTQTPRSLPLPIEPYAKGSLPSCTSDASSSREISAASTNQWSEPRMPQTRDSSCCSHAVKQCMPVEA